MDLDGEIKKLVRELCFNCELTEDEYGPTVFEIMTRYGFHPANKKYYIGEFRKKHICKTLTKEDDINIKNEIMCIY
jgi:hypothetical protein